MSDRRRFLKDALVTGTAAVLAKPGAGAAQSAAPEHKPAVARPSAALAAAETLTPSLDEAPATGIKWLLKPLFEMAIRKAVKKGLEEDRADLEERGYGTTPA